MTTNSPETGGVSGFGGDAANAGGTAGAGGATMSSRSNATGGALTSSIAGATNGATTSGGTSMGGIAGIGGQMPAGGSSGASAPAWTQLYDRYFAPGTAGDCVSCHVNIVPNFTNAATLCTALENNGPPYVDVANGKAHLDLLLSWFNNGGVMPGNGNPAPLNAVADIAAWQDAGAVCP